MSEIKKRALIYANEVTSDLGLYVWDLEYVKEGKKNVLRVYIDKDGGVSIDDCVNVSRNLEKVLDSEDFIEDAYTLEVSSPGINRKLKTNEHFDKFIGESVEVKTHKEVNGSKENIGKLLSHDDKKTVIENDEGKTEIENTNIIFVKVNC